MQMCKESKDSQSDTYVCISTLPRVFVATQKFNFSLHCTLSLFSIFIFSLPLFLLSLLHPFPPNGPLACLSTRLYAPYCMHE